MKNKKILRLEANEKWDDLSWLIRTQILDGKAKDMNQEEANWRVAIFRDEILDISEYVEYIHSPQAVADSEMWAEAV
ncbi:MAG: hypothetical protein K2P81_07035 [Bacteriovoracaceae bacterium]|nr:hypothetical protein [Bacteriovoracaceae bacterium]